MQTETMKDDDTLLTVAEVAATLRLSRATIYNYIKRGLLPTTRFPTGTIRIRRGDVRSVTTVRTLQQNHEVIERYSP